MKKRLCSFVFSQSGADPGIFKKKGGGGAILSNFFPPPGAPVLH